MIKINIRSPNEFWSSSQSTDYMLFRVYIERAPDGDGFCSYFLYRPSDLAFYEFGINQFYYKHVHSMEDIP